jgi:hypothetical protein
MEESVELMVFLGVGIVLLSLFTYFIYQWNVKDDVDALKGLYADEHGKEALKVDKITLMTKAREFWDECNHTWINSTRTYYVFNDAKAAEGSINRSDMFDYYKSLSWCKSIQSVNQSCGSREDINITSIVLPSLIRLSCRNQTLFVSSPDGTG